MSTTAAFLPSRDLRDLRRLELASRECLDDVATNVDSLALLLGASGGQILHAPPQLQSANLESDDAVQSSVEDPPKEVDAFEQRYITRWLTRLISELTMTSPDSQEAIEMCENLSQRCAELLAFTAGKMASGASVQDHLFQLADGNITVKLRDAALVHDSLGTHTWGAAPILSQLLLPLPVDATRDFSILELGAGTGLVGLAAAHWSRRHRPNAKTQVLCTDHHPTVLENLAHNIHLNGWAPADHHPGSPTGMVDVVARCLDWQSVHQARGGQHASVHQELTSQTVPSHLLGSKDGAWAQELDVRASAGSFDMIVAADCIYDPVHPLWIRSVAESLLKVPDATSSASQPLLHVMVPLRPTHQQEMHAVYEAFASAREESGAPRLVILTERDYQGYENFGAWNSIVRSTGSAHQSQPEGGLARTYRWFQIGWQTLGLQPASVQ